MNTENILQFPEQEKQEPSIELIKPVYNAEQEHFMKIYGAIPLATPEVLADIKVKKGLHLKYKHSYSCHKSIKEKCKKNNYILHPLFDSFSSFLTWMGANPSEGESINKFSVDRIDNFKLKYEPSNCRWATKEEQNNNKSDNLPLIHYTGTIYLEYYNKSFTLKQWSEATGTSYQTLYARYKVYNMTENEVIEGKHPKKKSKKSVDLSGWYLLPSSDKTKLEEIYQAENKPYGYDIYPNGSFKDGFVETRSEWIVRISLYKLQTLHEILCEAWGFYPPDTQELDPHYKGSQQRYDLYSKVVDDFIPLLDRPRDGTYYPLNLSHSRLKELGSYFSYDLAAIIHG